MYPLCVIQLKGLYASWCCRQNLLVPSHNVLGSHHILHVSQFLRVQPFAEIIILMLCMTMNSRDVSGKPRIIFTV